MKKTKSKNKEPTGYISVRNFPDIGDISQADLIQMIEDNFELCPQCQGICETYKEEPNYTKGVTSFKAWSSPLLIELRETETLTSDRIKSIVDILVNGKEICSKCHGLGLVKKSRKTNAKKSN